MSKHSSPRMPDPDFAAAHPDDPHARERAALRRQLAGTNIDENSFLATDYLNHFNEVIMLLEMAADVPDILEEVWDWQPISYAEHFRRSGFRDRDLAIAAYEIAPPAVRAAFDARVAALSASIRGTLDQLRKLCGDQPDQARIADALEPALAEIREHVSAINGIVHCGPSAGAPSIENASERPRAREEAAESDDEAADSISQADIDALFD